MNKVKGSVTKKQYNFVIISVFLFFMIIMGIVSTVNVKNSNNLREILTESIKAQLISISHAAREIIDVEKFIDYSDAFVAESRAYQEILRKLRILANNSGAKYIYALKRDGDKYVFIFDTDIEDEEIFIPYTLSQVHKDAFLGIDSAGIMNVDDEFGSYNTGAVPIWHNGVVVGIVSVDIEDAYLESSYNTSTRNAYLLIGILLVTMCVTLYFVMRLLNKMQHMQDTLRQMALYDATTGLPNRQHLMEHLGSLTSVPDKNHFALFFIDLDNFKAVNDNAGHDAGDELLRDIASYLDRALENAKSFRPSAGKLNIAARVGGDEFIQVVHGVTDEKKAEELAERLLIGFRGANLNRYIVKYKVGLSIGIALYPYHARNYNVLIKYADIAMYHAKKTGKNRYCLYNDEMAEVQL